MILARIVGTVVATRKDPRLVSTKLLVARPMDPYGKAEGNYLVAVDTVDAGVGERLDGPVEPAHGPVVPRHGDHALGQRRHEVRGSLRDVAPEQVFLARPADGRLDVAEEVHVHAAQRIALHAVAGLAEAKFERLVGTDVDELRREDRVDLGKPVLDYLQRA